MKAMTDEVLTQVEELIHLAREARESAESLAEDRTTYMSKFVEAVMQLDQYLTRKEIAGLFDTTESALNVMIHRRKKKDRE